MFPSQGNGVVWKPSDTAILSNYEVFKIFRDSGWAAALTTKNTPIVVAKFKGHDGAIVEEYFKGSAGKQSAKKADRKSAKGAAGKPSAKADSKPAKGAAGKPSANADSKSAKDTAGKADNKSAKSATGKSSAKKADNKSAKGAAGKPHAKTDSRSTRSSKMRRARLEQPAHQARGGGI